MKMGRGSRRRRLQQRRLRREQRLRVLLQPLPVPSAIPTSEGRISSTIGSTEYLVSYCYKNWHDWCTRVQSELTRRHIEAERPFTQMDETKITGLQRFAEMMRQVPYITT